MWSKYYIAILTRSSQAPPTNILSDALPVKSFPKILIYWLCSVSTFWLQYKSISFLKHDYIDQIINTSIKFKYRNFLHTPGNHFFAVESM